MTKKRKASLGLGSLGHGNSEADIESSSSVQESTPVEKEVAKSTAKKKKQVIPLYVDPALHEALHTLVFSERHKKTTFQTLFLEGLDLALKERGLPSVSELSSGEKTLNL